MGSPRAAEALGAFGAHGSAALPPLKAALEDPKEEVRDEASRSVRLIEAALQRLSRATP